MEHQNKMATQPMGKLICQMSLPALISMFFQYSYNFVDSAFVAQLGEDALAAVSLSFPLTTLMISASIWLGVGINVLVARYLGQGSQERADTVVSTGLLLSVVCGAGLNLAILAVLKPYFGFFAQDAEVYRFCMEYMRICVFMQVPNMVHIAIQKILQGTGNMLAPMAFQIAGVVFNFIFDPALIFGLWGFPRLGIAGAAIATVLGFTLSMVLAAIVLFFTKQKVHVKIRGFRLEAALIQDIFVQGFPSFILNALNAFMATFANLFLVGFSTTAVAFFGAYSKAQHMIVMTVNGLIQGCLPIMSFNYGAKDAHRLRLAFRYGTGAAAVLMGLGAIVVIVFPAQLLRLFMASDDMLSFGTSAMRIMALGYVCNGISTMIATYMQATRRTKASILINMMRQCLLVVPLMWLFSRIFDLWGIWLAFPVTEVLTLFIALAIQRRTASDVQSSLCA